MRKEEVYGIRVKLRNEKADKSSLTVLATEPRRGGLFVAMELKHRKSSVGAA